MSSPKLVQISSVATGKTVRTANGDEYEVTGSEPGARKVKRTKNVSGRPARKAIGNPVQVEVLD